MADQDPYAATAVKAPPVAAGGDPYAATAAPSTVTGVQRGVLRAPTQRERFLIPDFYPVGFKGEGVGENLKNVAQRAGVGIFQLADAATRPRQTFASILSSLLPEPVAHAANKMVDLENKIPGAHYLTTKLPENTPNPIAQAYQALAPGGWQAAGNVAPIVGQALSGEVLPIALPEIADDIKSTGEGLARAATDTGKTPVEALVKKTQAENEKIADVNTDRIARQQRDQVKADADHRANLLKLKQNYEQSVRDAINKARTGTAADRAQYQSKQLAAKQKYEQAVRDANEKYATDKTAAEQANAEALRNYNRKIGQTIQGNRAVAANEQARAQSVAHQQVVGSQLIYGINKLDRALRAQANQMYGAVRERMAGVSLPSDTLADVVKSAQEKWIRGSPEKVREFNAMLTTGEPGPELTLANQTAQNMGYKNFRAAITNPSMRKTLSRALPPDVWQAAIGQGTKPISWNDLQGFYEETGAKISDGPQPGKGDVFKALQQVHDEIGNQMQQLADAQGVGKQFRDARSFYREYMNVFHEPVGPSGSGSPIAQVLLAKDPLVAVAKFSGASGDRGAAILRRYDPALADLAQRVGALKRETPRASTTARKPIATVPAPKTKPVPAGPSLPLPPVLESTPPARAANLPLPPVLPEAEHIPAELKPRQTISSAGIERAREAYAASRRQWVNRRGAWVATWPIFEAMRALWGGHIPSIPAMGLESAGTFAMVRATSAMMEYQPMLQFLIRARPEDVALIPPELRGDLPGLVSIAQRRGIKVAPALIAATAGQGRSAQPGSPSTAVTQAIQAMQPVLAGGAQ